MDATDSTAFADRPEHAYAAKDMRVPDYWVIQADTLERFSTVLTARVIFMSMTGLVISILCIILVLVHSWFPGGFSGFSWMFVVIAIIASIIPLGWVFSTFPRIQSVLEEQRRVSERESYLRAQLEESYEQQKTLLEEVAQLYHEHAQAAITDAITALPNHRAVMSTFDDVLEQSRREHCSSAVLFIDLDHFKHVNDTWGHRAGDAILHEVAQRLRNTLRPDDFVGRYGGEEFAILLRETDIDEASHVGERLRVAISTIPCLYQPEDEQDAIAIPMTTSIGVAVYQLHGTTRESLITSADNAMYRAKRTGRNRVCLADVELDAVSMTPSQEVKTQTALEIAQATHAIHALTAAASARDGETHEHAHRMVELAEATARRLDCDGEEIRLIRLAALLHDIGKIGIPDAILHKPGPLTSDEWNVMRSHPEIGRSILERTGGVLRSLASVVAAHHERWDGSGYPRGLADEDIPLGARILSVVDSYDAMTSRRDYREPRLIDEARVELQRCSGSQFDPCVVAAFLAVLDAQGQVVDGQETNTRNESSANEENIDIVSV